MTQHAGIPNVLIVEDDRDARDMLVTLVTSAGFHAVSAEDGLEALHMLRTLRHRAPRAPCLVLLDLTMPRLSGLEFRRAQLGDPVVADVPVALMTGATDMETLSRQLGAVAMLPKPLDTDQVLEVIRRFCV